MLKSNIWKMYLFQFLFSLHFFGGVLVPFMLEWGRISFFQVMLLQSFYVVVILLSEIPTGAVADRFGRKTSLLISIIMMGGAVLVYGSFRNIWAFLIAEFMWGLARSFVSGADEAIFYDTLKSLGREKDTNRIFGRFHSFEILGYMVAAPIGSLIAVELGIQYPMLFMIFPCIASFIVVLSMEEPQRQKRMGKGYLKTISEGFNHFRSHKVLRILAFDKISVDVLSFFIIWAYQPLLMEFGMSVAFFGLVHAAMNGVQIPVFSFVGMLEKMGRKRYLFLTALITGLSFLLLAFVDNLLFAIFLIVVIAGVGKTRFLVFTRYLNKHIGSHNRATVLSTMSMIENLARFVLYPIFGFLMEISISYALIALGASILLSLIFSRVEERHLSD